MQLISINKARYRKHLNYVIVGAIATLATGALVISQSLIALYPDPSGSHFHWNLLGVVVTAVLMAWGLNKYRQHDFMTEVTYVWDLKQQLNKINRRLAKLKVAASQGNRSALLALQYSYAGSRLLWELDDNTIVMDQLALDQAELNSWAEQYEQTLNPDDYNEALLKEF